MVSSPQKWFSMRDLVMVSSPQKWFSMRDLVMVSSAQQRFSMRHLVRVVGPQDWHILAELRDAHPKPGRGPAAERHPQQSRGCRGLLRLADAGHRLPVDGELLLPGHLVHVHAAALLLNRRTAGRRRTLNHQVKPVPRAGPAPPPAAAPPGPGPPGSPSAGWPPAPPTSL